MEERTLFEYWMVLYHRKWIILIVLLSAVMIAIFLSRWLPPVYEAMAVIFVPKEPDVVTFFSTDASKSIAPKPSIPPTSEDQHAPFIGMLLSKAVARMVHEAYPQKPLARLLKDTDVELSNEFMLQIFVRDRDPTLAAELANGYVRALNELLRTFSKEGLEVQTAIEKQLEETRSKLEGARRALQTFQEREKIADLGGEMSELIRQESAYAMKIEDAKADLKGVEQRISGVQRQLQREASLYVSSDLITTNPLVESLRKDLADLEAAIGGGLTEQSARHPSIMRLRAQYEEKTRELEKEIRRVINSQTKASGSFYETLRQSLGNLLVEKLIIEARLVALGRTVSGIKERLARTPEIKAQHDEFVNNVNTYQKLVDTLSTDLEEARAQGKRFTKGAVVVDPAVTPDVPVFPIAWLNMIVAVGLGFIGGIFYCFLLDYIERVAETRRVKNISDSPAAAILLRRG